jgi:hypothetical protein
MPFSINSEPIKYAVVLLASPIWLPFIKGLIKEFNDALRDEGGLFGQAPSKQQLRDMDKELGRFESPMVSELHDESTRARNLGRAPKRNRVQRRGFGPRAR